MQSVKSRLEETRSRSIGLEEVWAGTSLAGRLCEVPTPVENLRTLEVFLARRLHPGKKQAVYAGPDGVVMHSQLTFGNGMIMVGSVNNRTPVSNLLKQPDEIGGAETQTPYLVVSDIDAIYASAKIAGAKMVIDLEEKDYGGKAFSCSDPEGHVWHVGTFDPWESQQA